MKLLHFIINNLQITIHEIIHFNNKVFKFYNKLHNKQQQLESFFLVGARGRAKEFRARPRRSLHWLSIHCPAPEQVHREALCPVSEMNFEFCSRRVRQILVTEGRRQLRIKSLAIAPGPGDR